MGSCFERIDFRCELQPRAMCRFFGELLDPERKRVILETVSYAQKQREKLVTEKQKKMKIG